MRSLFNCFRDRYRARCIPPDTAGRYYGAMKVGLVPALTLLSGLFSVGSTALAVPGESSPIPPSRFYVVTEERSDASPFWSTYILDVQPSGSGSLVRLI